VSDVLLAKLASRARDRRTQIDMGDLSVPKLGAPLTALDVTKSEAALGFEIPKLLLQLYQTVANGGFGPGYGLIGLHGGTLDDLGRDAIQLYQLYSSPDPDDADWRWPGGLLPICHWGCAIYSCIECTTDGNPMWTFDPNRHDQAWAQCFIPAKRSLENWLEAWAGGTKLWNAMNGGQQET
jgi:hypothetical protein